ncbi:MAG: hypothetical protein ABS78_22535 [Phenylobacterium sp. SCN 70-31]|nr:MAG: hypothetical protein ABS78_22535 [Phenylobacterium sp. SCN 70-31]
MLMAGLAVATAPLQAPAAAQVAKPTLNSAAPRAEQAWSRPAAQGGAGAGFMRLVNATARPDALVGAETGIARETQIHRTTVTDGVASMQRQAAASVPAGGQLVFAPGGYHLMFMGLKRPLKAGERFPVTLVFSSGARVKAEFVVAVAPPAAAGHDHHAH